MSVRIDPEKRELSRLLAYAGNLTGKNVLEVGCGNGRLTHQLAPHARHITGIDPNRERIAEARANTPPQLKPQITFQATTLENFKTDQRFDLVLLSWSL